MHALRIVSLAIGTAAMLGAGLGWAGQGAPRLAETPGLPLAADGWARVALQPHFARYRSYESSLIRLRALPQAERIGVLDEVLPQLEAQLARAPTDSMGWLVYAQFSAMRGGRLPQAIGGLRMSYYTGRQEMSVSVWRIAPVLWLLPLLPPDLQREADFEIERMATPWRTTSILERLTDAAAATGPDRVVRVLSVAARVSSQSEAVILQRLQSVPQEFFP